MPRTTIRLSEDAMTIAKRGLRLGKAVSELIRRAAERPVVTEERNGLRVIRLDKRSPKVAAALVERLREQSL